MKTSKAPALFVFHNEHNLAPPQAGRERGSWSWSWETSSLDCRMWSARREASFMLSSSFYWPLTQGHYKCHIAFFPSPSQHTACLSLLPLKFMLNCCAECVERCNLQMYATHTHPLTHTHAHLHLSA